MKKILLLLCLSFNLVGCERIAGLIFSELNFSGLESTQEQDLKAHQIYYALKNHDTATLNTLLSLTLLKDLANKRADISTLYQFIPAEESTDMQIRSVNKAIELPDVKYTAVEYVYTYPSCEMVLRVVFQGYEGSDEVIGVHLRQNKSQEEQC